MKLSFLTEVFKNSFIIHPVITRKKRSFALESHAFVLSSAIVAVKFVVQLCFN